ncbi:conserved exported protein of unknown function [Hyphomicrobium sp. 1Nfss2.1]|uniref:hypothetical protein n=1 Tax=Hyphomicrobium sp. 1Nfss2.1 TaxID=3413936 RepID=UPI003C7EB51B
MFRLIACTAALSLAALSPAFAEAAPDLTLVKVQASALVPVKTSDRTPDNAHPDRTPGASITGAAGTEVARTPFGTSDRTPENHYTHPSN